MRLIDRARLVAANAGLLVSRYTSGHRREDVRRISRVASERVLLLTHGEACQILNALQATAHLEGDVAELGVAWGSSARLVAEKAGGRTVHLFDTFDGLPAPGHGDNPKFQSGDFHSQLEDVQQYLSGLNCRFYKGLFPGTAEAVRDCKFSFVHLDVDLYESTLAGLEFFYPRMTAGAILISHDYLSAEGVDRAFEEFFSDKPERPIELVAGYQCMVVKTS